MSSHCAVAPLSKQKCLQRPPEFTVRQVSDSASFSCDGRLFHSPGPAAPNALSPKVVYVCITMHVRLTAERSRRSRASATRRQSSARYGREMPDSDWCTSVATLKSMHWRTGSQCSCRSTGDMWSERRVPVTRRAAAF